MIVSFMLTEINAVGDAEITVYSDSGRTEIVEVGETNTGGEFTVDLEPGQYYYTVKASLMDDLEDDFLITDYNDNTEAFELIPASYTAEELDITTGAVTLSTNNETDLTAVATGGVDSDDATVIVGDDEAKFMTMTASSDPASVWDNDDYVRYTINTSNSMSAGTIHGFRLKFTDAAAKDNIRAKLTAYDFASTPAFVAVFEDQRIDDGDGSVTDGTLQIILLDPIDYSTSTFQLTFDHIAQGDSFNLLDVAWLSKDPPA